MCGRYTGFLSKRINLTITPAETEDLACFEAENFIVR